MEEHAGCLGLGPHPPQTLPQGPQSLLSPSCPETEADLAVGRASVRRGPGPVQGAEEEGWRRPSQAHPPPFCATAPPFPSLRWGSGVKASPHPHGGCGGSPGLQWPRSMGPSPVRHLQSPSGAHRAPHSHHQCPTLPRNNQSAGSLPHLSRVPGCPQPSSQPLLRSLVVGM